MPSELFGDVAHHRPQVRSRNRAIVVGSISAHAVVIVGALFLSLSSPGALPVPRTALAFVDLAPEVRMADIELRDPAPSRPVTSPADAAPVSTAADAAPINAAPVVAPTGISQATDAEIAPRVVNRTAVDRIESGAPAGVGLVINRVERPAPVPAQTPVRLHSGIREPVKTLHVDPVYPSIAQQARVQGVVILEAVIGVSGRVESVHVLRSIPLLDGAAASAVRQWQYRPAMLNDQPIAVIVTVTVNFRL